MMPRARLWVLSGIALIVTILAACSSGEGTSPPTATSSGTVRTLSPSSAASGSAPPAAGSHPAAAWPTYNRTPDRAGVARGDSPAGALSVAWHAQLDGAVYGQPLIIGSLVVAATENDSVYALDSATGKVV